MRRSAPIRGSSVSPSAPQFHDRLSLVPSRPSSPLASLCLRSYDTRSRSVKPSCAVTKFTDAYGRRPPHAYRSLDPDSRYPRSRTSGSAPRQKSRTASR